VNTREQPSSKTSSTYAPITQSLDYDHSKDISAIGKFWN